MTALRFFVFLSLVTGLAGCLAENDSTAGIEGTGSPTTVVSGSVTAYGSIYVNGLHLDVDTAEVWVDGEPASEGDLKLGMVVEVEAGQVENDTAVAQAVRYWRSLRAPVASMTEVNGVRRQLTMLGQTVIVDEDSQFDGVAFEGLEAGLWLTVSGFTNPSGDWIATRVASASQERVVLQGPVSQLDRQRLSFHINALEVSYSDAEIVGGELNDGQTVRMFGGRAEGQQWSAERIELLPESGQLENGAVRFLEGVIQRYESLGNFELEGVVVDASGATVVGDLALVGSGARVSVSGARENGRLIAERLQLHLPGVLRLQGVVDVVDPESGELTLLGSTYQSTPLTVFDDRANNGRGRFGLTDLSAGDRVEVLARYRGEQLLVTRVKRLQPGDATVELRGPVTEVDQPNQLIWVMGTQVSLQGAQGAELLTDLRRGDRVEVTGQMTGSQSLSAETLKFSGVPGNAPGVCPPPLAEQCGGERLPFSRRGQTLRF